MTAALALRLDAAAWRRLVFAGSGWGLALASGFFALNAAACGLPCPEDIAATTAVCVGTGLLTIGPFAAFAGRR
jgi:hypothetical protein